VVGAAWWEVRDDGAPMLSMCVMQIRPLKNVSDLSFPFAEVWLPSLQSYCASYSLASASRSIVRHESVSYMSCFPPNPVLSILNVVGLPASIIPFLFNPMEVLPPAWSMGAWWANVTTNLRPRRSLSCAMVKALRASYTPWDMLSV
jgi:hypothetical protein